MNAVQGPDSVAERLMDIVVKNEYDCIKIYVNQILHVRFKQSDLMAIQSWRQDGKFCIEYSLNTINVLTEYDSMAKWTAILAQLDNIL